MGTFSSPLPSIRNTSSFSIHPRADRRSSSPCHLPRLRLASCSFLRSRIRFLGTARISSKQVSTICEFDPDSFVPPPFDMLSIRHEADLALCPSSTQPAPHFIVRRSDPFATFLYFARELHT